MLALLKCLTVGTWDLITSNRFWTKENILDTIYVYHSSIQTSEEDLRETLKDSEIGIPYYITPDSFFHGDSELIELKTVLQHVKSTRKVAIREFQTIAFQLLRNLVYFGLSNMLKKKKFQPIKDRSPIYYIPDRKSYVLRVHNDAGIFSAYRGFRPLLENHLENQKLALYFIEDTIFRIEEPIKDWKFWEGSIAGVRADFREDMDTRGGVLLDSIDTEAKTAMVTKHSMTWEVPLAGIYILGNSKNLRKAEVYQQLSGFARYKDSNLPMYSHLMEFISEFSENDSFTIAFDNAEQNNLKFYAETNEEET